MSSTAKPQLSTVANTLARSFASDGKLIYKRATTMYAAVTGGLSQQQVADATTEARVRLAHPDYSDDQVALLVNDPAYLLTKKSVNNYAAAVKIVAERLHGPVTEATIVAAFKVASRSGTSELIKLAEDAVTESGDAPDETGTVAILDGIILAWRQAAKDKADEAHRVKIENERLAELARKGVATGLPEEEVAGAQGMASTADINRITPPSLEGITAGLEDLVSREFTLIEITALLETMGEVYEHLSKREHELTVDQARETIAA
jgi:hypothetical protein